MNVRDGFDNFITDLLLILETVRGMAEVYYDVDLIDPVFEIFEDEKEGYRFRLRSPDGEILVTSETYPTKKECENKIKSIQTHAPSATVQDFT